MFPVSRSHDVRPPARPESTVIVNCAYPGAVLHRMVDMTRSPQFRRLLAGALAMRWDAILLSGGSTDISGDWINEIHLTREGYRKCAATWQKVLDPIQG